MMTEQMHDSIVDSIRKTERAMRVSVMIPHDEVDRVVVNRLIGMRNSEVNARRDMTHFDQVLRAFLTDDEFTKYVINKEEIEH